MSPVRWWWKFLRLPLTLLAVGYGLCVMIAPAIARSMLYYPQFGSHRAVPGLQTIRGSAGDEIAVWHLPNADATFTVWYFHGNAEDIGDIEPFLRMLHRAGFAVFAFDYPGYGLSTGRPSEKAIYAAARDARRYLREQLHVPAARTFIYGRSLGGGPATQMAIEEEVGGLVLQSTFTSAFRVVTRWPLLPFDQFVNIRKIPRLVCPLLIMHGEADEVIPFHHATTLFAAAREPKRALWVAGAHHNDFVVVAGDRLWTALREFSALASSADVVPR